MTRAKFHVAGDSLVGHMMAFDIRELGVPTDNPAHGQALADTAESIYRHGRESLRLSYDDRHAVYGAIETLRGLAVVVGPIAGDRHRNAADALARLLQAQEDR